MAIKLNEKTKTFIVYGKYKTIDGTYKNYQKQTDITSKKKAILFDKEYKNDLESKQIINNRMLFSELVDYYVQNNKLKNNTLSSYNSLEKIILQNDTYIEKINIVYLNELVKKTSYFHKIKTVLNWAYKYQYLNKKYADFLLLPKKEKQKKYVSVTDDMILKLQGAKFKNINVIDILFFLLDSGLRINECLSITFDRIYENHIVIDRQLDGKKWETLKSKNSVREIPITKRMREIIDRQIYVKDGFLFGTAQKIYDENITKILRSNKAGFTPHDLRHTHASNLIEYSYEVLGYCDKDNIAKHMGHTVAMLESTYKHLFRDKKHEILQVLEYVNERK